MMNLLSCRYNMDTDRVEARFEDDTTLAIDCIPLELNVMQSTYKLSTWSTVNHKFTSHSRMKT